MVYIPTINFDKELRIIFEYDEDAGLNSGLNSFIIGLLKNPMYFMINSVCKSITAAHSIDSEYSLAYISVIFDSRFPIGQFEEEISKFFKKYMLDNYDRPVGFTFDICKPGMKYSKAKSRKIEKKILYNEQN